MTIETLIDTPDNAEQVRDQVGAILVSELANQQTLASAAGKDPSDWNLRVFIERANPWESTDGVGVPLVNVWLDNLSFDESGGNQVELQKAEATFNVDCYGFGLSEDDGAGGHTPGDYKAAVETQRAVRLVRNILMAGEYTYLGLRGTVTKRRFGSLSYFQPQIESQQYVHVAAARVSFVVTFAERSPQVQGQPLEIINTVVKRESTGEVLAERTKEF